MEEDFELTRFEQELIRHLRALPFHMRQHVSRLVLKLVREQGTVPRDRGKGTKLGDPGSPVWNMTPDEIAKIRDELREEDAEQ